MSTVGVNLDGFDGDDDGAPDSVTAVGTEGPDAVSVGSDAGAVVVTGLLPVLRVTGGSAAQDSVGVETLGGDDRIASGVTFAGAVGAHVDGGLGDDALRYAGSDAADTIGVARDDVRVATFTASGAPVEIAAVEHLTISGGRGNDTVAAQNGIGLLTQLTLDGGPDDDVLRGGDGNDLLIGGNGDDTLDGNIGSDVAQLGAGADRFEWDPGDGSDTVDGDVGADTLQFNGSNAAERIDVRANGPRVRLTRDVAAVVTDAGGIEDLELRTLGSADVATVGDLTGTELTRVHVDLASTAGDDDQALDTVLVEGTAAADAVTVGASAGEPLISGLAARVQVGGAQPGDVVQVAGLGGDDRFTSGPGAAGVVHVDGGAGRRRGRLRRHRRRRHDRRRARRQRGRGVRPRRPDARHRGRDADHLGSERQRPDPRPERHLPDPADRGRRRGRRHGRRRRRRRPAAGRLGRRPRRRQHRPRRRSARNRQRPLPVGPGRRQRHGRRRPGTRHARVQRLERRGADRGVGRGRPVSG